MFDASHTSAHLVAALFALCAMAWSSPATAGPWIPEPGSGYVKVSGEYFDATGVFDRAGDARDPEYQYLHRAARLYADVGVAPHVAFAASVPYLSAENRRPTDEGPARYIRSGFGDLDLELQGGSTLDNLSLTAVGRVRLPLYDETISADAPNPLAYGPNELRRKRYLPALGDGSVDLAALAQAGLSLHPAPLWLSASVGPKFRLQGFGDGLQYGAGIGASPIPDRLAVQARVDGIQRFSDDNRRPTKNYLQLSGGPMVTVHGPWSVAGNVSYTPTGAFVSRGWSVSAGVSYEGRIFPNPYDRTPSKRKASSD